MTLKERAIMKYVRELLVGGKKYTSYSKWFWSLLFDIEGNTLLALKVRA